MGMKQGCDLLSRINILGNMKLNDRRRVHGLSLYDGKATSVLSIFRQRRHGGIKSLLPLSFPPVTLAQVGFWRTINSQSSLWFPQALVPPCIDTTIQFTKPWRERFNSAFSSPNFDALTSLATSALQAGPARMLACSCIPRVYSSWLLSNVRQILGNVFGLWFLYPRDDEESASPK